jgi:ATP-dependent Clp protease ATP-binding subunit ClpB
MRQEVQAILENHFRPEFLNRLDEIIIFRPLSQEVIMKILDLQINVLRRRLREQKLNIDISPEAKKILAERGYDPVYGARPLKRTLQKDVQNPLAKMLLEGKFKANDTIHVGVDDKQELTFTSK